MTRLVAAFLLLASSTLYGYGGGEDFPFRCEGPANTDVRIFDIVPDFDSDTGYSLRFTLRIGAKGSFPVEITESVDRRYYIVKGSIWRPLGIFERHIVAHIAKTPGQASLVATQLTFPGMSPNYGEDLGETLCLAH